MNGTTLSAGKPLEPDRFSQAGAYPILPNGLPESLLSFLSASVFFLGGNVLEIILQSRPGWAYYPARVSLGGPIESVGSHRVAQGNFFHHRRRKEIFSITEETSVHQAAQYLREKQVRSVGVMNASGKLTGVISQSDVSDKVAAENKCPAWMKTSDIMTRELVTVTAEKTLDECLRLMEQNGIFHLIVLDERGEFRGMLSISDILRVVASDEKARADLLEAFIFPQR